MRIDFQGTLLRLDHIYQGVAFDEDCDFGIDEDSYIPVVWHMDYNYKWSDPGICIGKAKIRKVKNHLYVYISLLDTLSAKNLGENVYGVGGFYNNLVRVKNDTDNFETIMGCKLRSVMLMPVEGAVCKEYRVHRVR